MSPFVYPDDERILVSGKGCEDAVVVRFPPNRAMVQSVDFLTPIVNDPYGFGCIAAANALSDIYAMGGEPYTAMNIVCFPKDCLPLDVLTEILRGGGDTVQAAGAVVAGGHTVEDQELKFGLAVTGVVDPEAVAVNGGARPGDHLLLTKPLGTGILATAVKAEWTNADVLEETLVHWCGRLNAAGSEVIKSYGIKGATDVTGFGLGGHVLEMAQASAVHIRLMSRSLPIMDQAWELAAMGLVPAGAYANKTFCRPHVRIAEDVDPLSVDLVFDPQTSGGLILAVPEPHVEKVSQALRTRGDMAVDIGTVLPPDEHGVGVSLL